MVGGRPDDLIRYGHDLIAISRAVDEGRRQLVAGAQLGPRDLGTMTASTRIVGVLDRVLAAVDAAAGHVSQTARHDGHHLQQAASDLAAAPRPGIIDPVDRGRVIGPVLGRAEPHRRGPTIDLQPSAPVMGHVEPYHRGPTITDEGASPVMGHAEPYHRGPTITDEGTSPVMGHAEPYHRGPTITDEGASPVMGHAEPYHRGPTITDEGASPVMGHAEPHDRGPTLPEEPGTEDS